MECNKTKIRYSEEFAKKKFVGKNQKQAYVAGMKWYATSVLANQRLHNVQLLVEKVDEVTVVFHMFAVLNEEELRERHCEICRESHKSFFINENCNCAWCNTSAYQRRADEMLSVKAGYCREQIREYL